jgi:membrane protein required for colicin V production
MNLVDLLIIAFVLYFAFRGYWSGFVKQVFGIAAIIIAVFATFRYMSPASALFHSFIDNPDHATILAGVIIFILSLSLIQLAGYWLEKALKLVKINFINRFAGLVFGSLNAMIISSAILLLLAGFNLPKEETRANSHTYDTIIRVAPLTFNMIATIYPDTVDFMDTIEKSIRENNSLREMSIFENINL